MTNSAHSRLCSDYNVFFGILISLFKVIIPLTKSLVKLYRYNFLKLLLLLNNTDYFRGVNSVWVDLERQSVGEPPKLVHVVANVKTIRKVDRYWNDRVAL